MNKTKQAIKINIEKLLGLIATYNKEADLELVKRTFEFAKKSHEGQKRLNGDDYIIHPLNVALILAEMKMDEKTIVAALLHDLIEKCNVTERDIEQKFSSEIAKLVSGVTKLGEMDFDKASFGKEFADDPKRIKNIESLRKLFLAMAEDIRVVLIKLADRYHNLKTLHALSEKDQKRIAEETLDIFAPLADRLGMGRFKADLEDLAFQFSNPSEFKNILKLTKGEFLEKEKYLKDFKKYLEEILKKEGIEAEIEGRAKHLYSVYKKLKKEGDISKIYDLMAIRIIVPTKSDCYKTMGIVHSRFKPLIYRIKDYIAVPKPNGYQSLHTTVFGLDGKITEIQIRTAEMHEEAEKGVAAHWHYNEMKQTSDYSKRKSSFAPKDKIQWIKELLDWQEKTESTKEFFEGLKIDVFKDRIFVFSPKGDVFDLPEGSTPVDFAYAVHGWIGDHLVGAKVNGKMISIDEPLENRDIVEIITKKNSPGPKRDWLKFAVTSKAKQRIRAYLNKESK